MSAHGRQLGEAPQYIPVRAVSSEESDDDDGGANNNNVEAVDDLHRERHLM